MPLYEYECAACGHRFERIKKFSDPPVDECPNCGERQVQKLLSSPAIQFKGTGWYITDYAKKGAAAADGKTAATDTAKDGSESAKSKEPGESKESKDSKVSKESKSAAPASGAGTTPKASGE